MPSLQLSWVSQQLRAVFMPRFWSFICIKNTRLLARLVRLIETSPPNTYRDLVRFLSFENFGGRSCIDLQFYHHGPPPHPESEVDPEDAADVFRRELSENCGPREGETWPTPMELTFSDPKRFFMLAARKDDAEDGNETDESGSSAESEAEEEEENCKI